MGWKATGEATVPRPGGKWVVRLDGIDTQTGKHRPRRLGTYQSRRSALAAARTAAAEGRPVERGTVGWLVRRFVASRTDVASKTREQYEWAIPHIESGLGAVSLDRLDRADVAAWLDRHARDGKLSRRSIQVSRNVLRAALADAVEEGLLRRSPAARVAMPREVRRPDKVRETEGWTDEEVTRFLVVGADHRWSVASGWACSMASAAARSWRSAGTTSTGARGRSGSTRVSYPLVAVPPGPTPRTLDPGASFPSMPTRSGSWSDGGASRSTSDYSPVPSGWITIS